MVQISRRTLAKGAGWSAPALMVGSLAPAYAASPKCPSTIQTAAQSFAGKPSTVISNAPSPGAATAGQFTIVNPTTGGFTGQDVSPFSGQTVSVNVPAAPVPAGAVYTVKFEIFKNGSTGASSGYQSYVSTTTSPSAAGSFNSGNDSNAHSGSPGSSRETLTSALAPGSTLAGTWSGSWISLDFETVGRYRVSITSPAMTYTYNTTYADPKGKCPPVTISHSVSITPTTAVYDNAGKGV